MDTERMIWQLFLLIFLIFSQCAFLPRKGVAPVEFNYQKISENYFTPANEGPFPLTIQRGDNLYNSTDGRGRYLFYTTDNKGNYDIWFRDLNSSVIVPVTNHPSAEYKPAISPDGTRLAFVSERYDSEGDIVLLDIEPKKWIEKYLKGQRFINTDFQVLTNPAADGGDGKPDRNVDTDPVWSPDGKYILFATTRNLTRGLPNLVLYNLQTEQIEPFPLSENYGTSPYWSMDGKFITYISYKDSPYGEIYLYDWQNKKETRITNNQTIEYSPSLSHNSKVLFYTSIEKDTNGNGRFDGRDNGYIVRYQLAEKRKNYLTSGTVSLFDSRYSTFLCDMGLIEQMKQDAMSAHNVPETCGSILFSAALFNTINIYFIPINGPIPQKNHIEEQFSAALRYKNQSYAGYNLALDSVELFFKDDPLFPIYAARVALEKYRLNRSTGRKQIAHTIIKQMLSHRQTTDKEFLYAIAYAEQNPGSVRHLQSYYAGCQKKGKTRPEVLAAILELIADKQRQAGSFQQASRNYQALLKTYPKYHAILDIKRKLNSLLFHYGDSKIPEDYFELMNRKDTSKSTLNLLQNELQQEIDRAKTYEQKLRYVELLLRENSVQSKSTLLYNFLLYQKARALFEGKHFKKSLEITDSYIGHYEKPENQIIDKENRIIIEDRKFRFKDPLYLKTLLLRARNSANQENLVGAGQGYFNNVKFFLVNYEPEYGVEIKEKMVIEMFRFYENVARKKFNEYFKNKELILENEKLSKSQKLAQIKLYQKTILVYGAFNYFYNTENMFLIKSKNLFLDSFYKKNAIYYYKKMVEALFTYGREISETDNGKLLSRLNKNILGTSTRFIANVFDNKLTGKYTGKINDLLNVKNLQTEQILGDHAVNLAENFHFKEALPRARNHLYLASIYGHAFYLIRKAITFERFYDSTDTMTAERKEQILTDLKKAEFELKWAIFANPRFADAYQLLGWLYQYIDISKSKQGKYSAIYIDYFPGRHIEENIDFYKQILSLLSDSKNKKLLSDINLNLGNNYLMLNNYPKAKEHYSRVDVFGKYIIDSARFESYQQKAIYHYNYARTLIYLGEYSKAIENLNQVRDIYYNKEYFNSISTSQGDQKEGGELYLQISRDVSQKMILIEALKGLVAMESRQFIEAIRSFKKALALNIGIGYIRDSNLYNALAICYQNLEEFEKSEQFISLAREALSQEPDKKERDWSISGILAALVPGTIGEGRFPNGFPPEYSQLLARGIQIGNYEARKQYTRTNELMEKRDAYIRDRNLDESITGKRILAITNSRKAYNKFAQGNFWQSHEAYEKAYQQYKEQGNEKKFRETFESACYAYFKTVELGLRQKEDAIFQIKQHLTLLQQEKQQSIQSCLEKAGSKQSLKIRRNQCQLEFIREWKYYEPLMGMNYNYLGDVYLYQKKPELAYRYYGMALNYLKNPGKIDENVIGLPGDIFNKKQRLRLTINLARIYYKLADSEKFSEQVAFAENFAIEYGATEELAKIKLLRADYIFDHEEKTKKNLSIVLEELLAAEKNILNDYGIMIDTNVSFFKNLYRMIIEVYHRLGKDQTIYLYDEKLRNIILFKTLVGDKVKFQNPKLRKLYFKLRNEVTENFHISNYIEKQTAKRKPVLSLIAKRDKINTNIKKRLVELSQKFPNRRHFFDLQPSDKISDYLNSGQVAIRFLRIGDDLVYWLAESRREKVATIAISKKQIHQLVSDILQQNLGYLKRFQHIIFIPDESVAATVDFYSLAKNILPKRIDRSIAYRNHHMATVQKTKAGRLKKYLHISSLEEKAMLPEDVPTTTEQSLNEKIYDVDVLQGVPFVTDKNLFGEIMPGYLNLREIFQKENNISLVLLENGRLDSGRFNRTIALIDILRASNVQAIVLLPEHVDHTKLKFINNIKRLPKWLANYQYPSVGLHHLLKSHPQRENLKLFQKHYQQGKSFEILYKHRQALLEYLSADAYLRSEARQKLKLDIRIAIVKTNLYRQRGEEFIFFDDIIKEHAAPEAQAEILLSFLHYCYSNYNSELCQSRTEQLNRLVRIKEFREETLKKEAIATINFYRSIDKGKLINIARRYQIFIKFFTGKKRFFFHYNLAKVFLRNNFLKIASEHIEQAYRLANNRKEKELATKKAENISAVQSFLGFHSNRQEYKYNTVYTLGLTNQWNAFEKILKSMDDSKLNSLNTYRKRIFTLWKDMATGYSFDPLQVSPDRTSNGISIFEILSQLDRTLVFHLLKKSIPYQEKDEIDKIFKLLIQAQHKTGNSNIVYLMKISWAESLYHNGETEKAINILEEFEKEHLKYISRSVTLKRYLLLKYKLSLIKKKKVTIKNEELRLLRSLDKTWYPNYVEVSNIATNRFLPFLNQLVRKERNTPLNHWNLMQLSDFIFYLQNVLQQKSNEAGFLDMVFIRDRIRSQFQRHHNQNLTMRELPEFYAITSKLKQKIPANQFFIAVFQYGNATYKASFQKSEGVKLKQIFEKKADFKNINSFKNLIYNYHKVVKREGGNLLQKDFIESTFRNAIHGEKGEWKKINYLYLSSFIIKVPLELRQGDNIFYVQNPYVLEKSKPFQLSQLAQKAFRVKRFEDDSQEKWVQVFKRLEEIEIPSSSRIGKITFHLSDEYLHLKNYRTIFFGNKSIRSKFVTRNAPWLLMHSGLYKSSFYSDDINYALFQLSNFHKGPGVISLGEQSYFSNILLAKQLTKKSKTEITLKSRFVDGINHIKERYPEEKYWNGYKLYTTTFLLK